MANGVAGAIVAVAVVGGVTMWVQRDTGETVSAVGDTGETVSAVGDADGVSTTIGSIDPSTGDFVAAGAPLEFEVVDAEGLARLVRNVVVLDDGTQFGVSTSTASGPQSALLSRKPQAVNSSGAVTLRRARGPDSTAQANTNRARTATVVPVTARPYAPSVRHRRVTGAPPLPRRYVRGGSPSRRRGR